MEGASATRLTPALQELVATVRREIDPDRTPADSARAVAGHLEEFLTEPDLLDPGHREPSEDDYRQHVLHVEPDGSFSIVCLVWLAGQETPVHDHVAWCVPGVYRGREEETRYRLVGARRAQVAVGERDLEGHREDRAAGTGREGPYLEEAGTVVNGTGTVVSLTPPGDIHRVRNPGPEKAISLHVYGADIARLGSSIRRTYDLPVRPG